MDIQFTPWPKIPRWNRDIIITEKLDGTNSAIGIAGTEIWAQSRNRIITPTDDNFGFAKWVHDNAQPLIEILGDGVHFGEWWGRKIGRAYNQTERFFSLFNTTRWTRENTAGVKGLRVVPILYEGPLSEREIIYAKQALLLDGSVAAPGFIRPEGIVIYHTAANSMFKVTLQNDATPKSQL